MCLNACSCVIGLRGGLVQLWQPLSLECWPQAAAERLNCVLESLQLGRNSLSLVFFFFKWCSFFCLPLDLGCRPFETLYFSLNPSFYAEIMSGCVPKSFNNPPGSSILALSAQWQEREKCEVFTWLTFFRLETIHNQRIVIFVRLSIFCCRILNQRV